MNNYSKFIRENRFTKEFIKEVSTVRINSDTNDINLTINNIYKLNNYLQNGFLNMKLYNVKIYEFPCPEEDIEEEKPLLFSFIEICISDLMTFLYNKKGFLKEFRMLLGGQDGILYKFIESIENQYQEIKLTIIKIYNENYKDHIDYKDILTNIYITFTTDK
jgi:hypothetical protein